jgi:hypothetical protein
MNLRNTEFRGGDTENHGGNQIVAEIVCFKIIIKTHTISLFLPVTSYSDVTSS